MNSKIKPVEGWKGIMSVMILLLHYEASVIGVQRFFKTGYLAVEFFFIVSGFLVCTSFFKHDVKSFSPLNATVKKIIKIYPLYLVAILILLAMYKAYYPVMHYCVTFNYRSFFTELLLLQNIFPANLINFTDWYISSLVVSSYLMLVLLKFNSRIFLAIVAPLSAAFIYGYFFLHVGHIDLHGENFGIFNSGLLRGWAGMCLGSAMFSLTRRYNFNSSYAVNSVAEVLATAWLFSLLIGKYHSPKNFVVLIPVCILLLMSVQKNGLISKMLSMKFFVALGSLSLPIFLLQSILICIFLILRPVLYNVSHVIKTPLFIILTIASAYGINRITEFFVQKTIVCSQGILRYYCQFSGRSTGVNYGNISCNRRIGRH